MLRFVVSVVKVVLIFCLQAFSIPAFAQEQEAELRIGAFKEIYYKSSTKNIKIQKQNILNVQYLFPSLGGGNEIYATPRPHLGGMVNLNGGTNQYYAGLTWHVPFDCPGLSWDIPLENFFMEISLGGEMHNGPLKKPSSKKNRPLGSRLLFRESVSIGLNVGDVNTISIVLDHASNAHLANPNSGLTDIGLQIGYKF